MKRTVAAVAALVVLAGCGQPPAEPVEQPAHQVDVDAVGEDPTGCDATTHGLHDHTTGHVCPTEHGGH
jgi:predicted component of type VI protein secretion system